MTPAPTGEPCSPADVFCWTGAAIGNVVSKASNDALQQFVNNILEGYGKAIASLGTVWMNVPSPVTVVDQGGGVNGGGTPPLPEAFETILGYVTWVSAGLAVMSLIVAGVMMASRRRHGDGEAHMGRIGVILLAVLLLSSASALVTGFLPLAMHLNESSSVVGWVQGQLQWYTGGLAILAILVAAGRMVWTQRALPLRELAGSVITLIAVAGAGLVVIRLATQAGDEFSIWILNNSTDCDVSQQGESNCFGTNVFAMIALTATSGIGLIGLFLLGMLAVFMTYVQIALMVFRGAMLVVLAGIFPLAASFTNTEIGRQWFKKAMAWTLAFILYKPAAAIVYAIAFRMTGTDLFKSDGTGLFQIVTGLALMLIALVALPALMRFLVPAVASVGGGGAAGLLLGAAALSAAGDVATGAIRASNNGGGGGGGGGGNSSSTDGPTGSTSSPGSPASSPGADPSGSAATAGSGAGAGAGSAATSGAGAGASSGAGAGAAAGGAAAAAGPIGAGIAVATKAAEGAKHAAQAVKAGTEEATGSNENGS
ncbi:hypothetical protein C5D04_10095 [Rathayibacter sp. AY1D2]|uniref:hypothetical protein n=2 Tax=Rathayibacter TaxID=33886 RepID=UPI000CE7BAE3|nr:MULTISPECIES: hypothetical protein [unclassified Rathayibacter]PPH43729.1 hypothetical protein C5D09_14555 [Rathayibacter sp. AY1C9]PPG79282.1 hypothetical protein C5C52_12640 [Rathayibacter sp. AY1E5]PPH18448.1 hypothetical protein C5C99_13665 [Rathayibacter sp. AY1C4]PPH27141.1 hypothetical protein C5C37_14430 [Rathayibacter sp. AY1F9]PPH65123.1 hypothetical protein C5D25_04695 [Rathayibacter sp. AY1D7]